MLGSIKQLTSFQPRNPVASDDETHTSQRSLDMDIAEEEEDIPGTVRIIDYDNKDATKHEDGHPDIVLVPQPSSDPNDPLNWSKRRKAIFMFFAILYTMFICSVTSVVGICAPGFAKHGISAGDVAAGSGYAFLCLGWFNLILQPLAASYGRRPILIVSLLVAGVGCSVWLGEAKSAGSYYGSRVVQGVFGAPVESLIEVLVADVFFVHDRAFWMSWYGFGLQAGSDLGPVASGFIFENMGVSWVFYFHAIFMGALAVLMFFFMEESGYKRVYTSEHISQIEVNTSPGTADSTEEGIHSSGQNIPEKKSPYTIDNDTSSVSNIGEVIPAPKTYWQRIPIYSRIRPFPTLFEIFKPIFILYKFPQIFWAGSMLAAAISCFQVLTGTVAEIFQAPPYNFSTEAVGLAYIGPTVSTVIVCYYSGPLCDKFCLWMAKRRGGIHEAEDRIYLGLICILLTPVGCFMYGVGAYHHVHWIVLIIGLSIMSGVITISSNIPYSYALDCCQYLGADCIVSIVLMRNTVSFAFAYAINPWIKAQGLQNTFLAVGFILGFAFWGTAIPMIIYGKKVRKLTKETYLKWSVH